MNSYTNYDLCIVGTGPSSFFLVKKVLEKNPSTKIIIIEAGSKNKKLRDNKTNSYNHTGLPFKLNPTTFIGLGGTSELWHNVLAPMDEIDFMERSWISGSGWPINYQDLEMHYKEVANYFDMPFHLFKKNNFKDILKKYVEEVQFDASIFDNKIFMQPKSIFRSKQAFIKELIPNSSIKILYEHEALSFDVSKDAKSFKADRIVCGNKKTNTLTKIEAKSYIICAGALSSPRILLNTPEISRRNTNIGKYLLDHPMGNFYQMKYQDKKVTKLYTDLNFNDKWKVKSAIVLDAQFQEKNSMPNSAFFIRPSFYLGIDQRTDDAKLALLTMRNKLLNFKVPFKEASYLLTNINLARQVLQYKTGLSSKHKWADFMFVTEQIPRAESMIYLSNKKDRWGMSEISINWNLSNQEINNMEKFYDLIDVGLNKMNNSKMVYKKNDVQWLDRMSSAAHHMGTCRMSNDIKNGVVDKNLKVHGSRNIYICDGSVFPTVGNANPTFTNMAISNRLGEFLTNEKI